jgi:hypothetical protein
LARPVSALFCSSFFKQNSSGQVIVLWACEHPPPVDSRWPPPPEGKHFLLLREEELLVSNRLFPYDQIEHDAVLSLDNDVSLHPEEIAFAFSTWLSFPERIVGFPSRVRCPLLSFDFDLGSAPDPTKWTDRSVSVGR